MRECGTCTFYGTVAIKMSKKHMGSRIDDFLKEEGIFEEGQAEAVKEVVAWQLAEAMKKRKISKNKKPFA